MPKRVVILSLTEIFDEPRVRRQAQAFSELSDWQVVLVGMKGRSKIPADWEFVELDAQEVAKTNKRYKFLPLVRLFPFLAEKQFWRHSCNRYIYQVMQEIECDLVIAHDYFTAPIAAKLADAKSARFVIDCHEYARQQFHFSGLIPKLIWKLFDQPYIDAIQRKFLNKADGITTVCDGIADLLHSDYSLRQRPGVVRSFPFYQEMKYRPCGDKIKVLYHGLVVPTRGMENAIRSVKEWREEFELHIRGVGNPAYFDELRQLADRLGVGGRVFFPDPVSFVEMVKYAAEADIGYVVLDNYSPQRKFTLPNKFFEYIMAGLAVVCSNLHELAKISQAHDIGVLVDSMEPTEIANKINALTREQINIQKQKSLQAAQELCWENEVRQMFAAYLPEELQC